MRNTFALFDLLLVATHANKSDAAKALIDAGADVNAKSNINDSPTFIQARGHLEILEITIAMVPT